MNRKDFIFFFGGVDPAPSESQKSDDGAVLVAAATPKQWPEALPMVGGRPAPIEEVKLSENPSDWNFDFVYGRRFTWKEKLSARQWSSHLHVLHQRFGFSRICMDPNAGGVLIKRELIAPKQLIGGAETDVTPIADMEDGPKMVVRGDFILSMFKRGDPGVESLWPELAGDELLNDRLYSTAKEALDNAMWGFPMKVEQWLTERRSEVDQWPEERQWAMKCLDATGEQLVRVVVAVKPDGTWLTSPRGARKFSALGKKDFVSAAMYAYAGFLMWLRGDSWRTRRNSRDAVGFGGRMVVGGRSQRVIS